MPITGPVEITDQSPKVTIDVGKEIRVERVYFVPKNQDALDFALSKLNTADTAISIAYCVRADVERLVGDYYQVRLTYSTESPKNDRSTGDRPGSGSGGSGGDGGIPVTFTLNIRGGGEFMLFPARDARWEDNLAADPNKAIPDQDSQAGRIVVPKIEYRITAENVITPPLATLAAKVGHVNQGPWLGWPDEVVLFESYSMDYRWQIDNKQPILTWTIELNFIARPIKVGNKVYGWNHEYRGKDGWKKIYMYDGTQWTPRYPSTTFSDIFV